MSDALIETACADCRKRPSEYDCEYCGRHVCHADSESFYGHQYCSSCWQDSVMLTFAGWVIWQKHGREEVTTNMTEFE